MLNILIIKTYSKSFKTLIIFLLFLILKTQAFHAQNLLNQKINNKKEFDASLVAFDSIRKNLYNFNRIQKNYTEVKKYCQNIIDWAEKNTGNVSIIKAKYNLLLVYFDLGDNFEVIARTKDLLTYKEESETSKIVSHLYRLKLIYKQAELYREYLDILPEYHKYSKKYNIKTESNLYYEKEVAFIYYKLKDYEKAIEYFKILSKKEEYIFDKASRFNDIGQSFSKLNQIDSAKYYYNKAIKLSEEWKLIVEKRGDRGANYLNYIDYFVDVIKANKATLKHMNNDYKNTLPLFFKELKGAKKFEEKNIIVNAYFSIAHTYFNQNKPNLSLAYSDSILLFLKNHTNYNQKLNALNLKGKSLLLLNKSNQANIIFKKHDTLLDSLNTEKRKKEYRLGAIKHETSLKEEALNTAKLKSVKEKKIIENQQYGLIFLIIIVVGSLFFYFKLKRKSKIIQLQKNLAAESLKEKEVLLKEIHHRVKNNLQVVSGLLAIQSKKDQSENFNHILNQSQSQIESMSLVHEMLYQKENLNKISMQEYLEKLSTNLLISSGETVTLNINANTIYFHIDYANPMGLILNELITNSIKHGFKGRKNNKIFITITQENDVYVLKYSDNGIGLATASKESKNKKFGERLIKSLSEEMGANYSRNNKNGVSYIFNFKVK